LRTLSGAAEGRILDKRTARRQRAVILTAKAMQDEVGNPDVARQAALEAHDLASDLVPAGVVAGRLLSRQGDIRRATRVLETAWKAQPHPEIADAYLHVRAGDSAGDRLKRAEALMRLRPQADEGRIAVARAAIDARDFERAREVLTPVLTNRPTQTALFVMADLVENETGDAGRAREWMARAVRAPRDPAWTADGMVLEHWAPASPVTSQIDAVEWKVPVAELEGPHLQIDAEDLKPAVLEPAIIQADELAMDSSPDIASAPATALDEALERDVAESPSSTQTPDGASEASPASIIATPALTPATPVGADPQTARSADETGPALHVVPAIEPEADPALAGPGLPHMPDDPGVAEGEAPEEKPRRFRIL
jgi:HemY protein